MESTPESKSIAANAPRLRYTFFFSDGLFSVRFFNALKSFIFKK
jgi:hypothetical protein